jgi:formylglycine-generating enzyme required for sulfatase activity
MSNISKNYIVFSAVTLLFCMFCGIAATQSVSGLIARYIDCQAVVKFNLTAADSGTQITLMYSGDNGVTWLPCSTINGDTGVQTSGSKTIVWDCKADGVGYGVVEFRVDYPQPDTGCDEQKYTVTDITDSSKAVSFTMKCIPVCQGFTMGQSGGQAAVYGPTIASLSTFSIGETEVTQGLWWAVMGAWPSTSPDTIYGVGDDYPMYYVSWNDIVGTSGDTGYEINGLAYHKDGFCYRLSELVGGGLQFRLPTETEWEYAARGVCGDGNTGYYYGTGTNTLSTDTGSSDGANYYASGGNLYDRRTPYNMPVKSYATNHPFGLYDMSGNVYESCSDVIGLNNGNIIISVFRGGRYSAGEMQCRVSERRYFPVRNRLYSHGFRLACSSK